MLTGYINIFIHGGAELFFEWQRGAARYCFLFAGGYKALLLAGANAAGGVWRMNELNGLFIRRVINGNRRAKKWWV